MRTNRMRRLLVLGISVPTLIAGGVLTAHASTAAPSTASTATVTAATPATSPRVAQPAGCTTPSSMRFVDRTDVFKDGKLIGHASFYEHRYYVFRDACVIMWRNGEARGNADLTRAHVSHCGDRVARAIDPVRSAALSFRAQCDFRWWGAMRYQGEWFVTEKKVADLRDNPYW